MRIHGVDLSVRDGGGTGTPVLLIHGSPFRDFLLPLGEVLTATGTLRVISYERRGYGRRQAGTHDMTGEAADASDVLRQIGIGKAHVFGHSTGASIALQLAHQSPDRMASLMLGEADVPWRHSPSRAAIEGLFAQLAEMYRHEPKKAVLGALMHEIHGPDYLDVFPADMLERGADDMSVLFTSEYQAMLDWQLGPDAVQALAMPVQCIYGEHTSETAKEMGDVLQRWNGGITEVEIPGSTHTFPWTHPHETARVIADFVRRHPR